MVRVSYPTISSHQLSCPCYLYRASRATLFKKHHGDAVLLDNVRTPAPTPFSPTGITETPVGTGAGAASAKDSAQQALFNSLFKGPG
jgi:hypothetical protein